MAKNKHVRVKMRNSLHGVPIAVDPDMSANDAGEILRAELVIRTPRDTGAAKEDWRVKTLANGDIRVVNTKPYIRRLAIDGSSPQARPGYYNDAIDAARSRVQLRGAELEEARATLADDELQKQVAIQKQKAIKLGL